MRASGPLPALPALPALLALPVLLSSPASANLRISWVNPTCSDLDPVSRCLRGQHCDSNRCVPDYVVPVLPSAYLPENVAGFALAPPPSPAGGSITKDGTCGRERGDTYCGDWPLGGCCSPRGWCGNTTDHCGPGCQSGPCGPDPATGGGQPSISSTTTKVDAVPSAVQTSEPSSIADATTDGTCGAQNGGTVCGTWPQGDCCSMYGFCGKKADHCGPGCQSGSCTSEPTSPAPELGPKPAPPNRNPGRFSLAGRSGVPAMHAGLLPNGRVFFLDKVENYTEAVLPDGRFAYSSEYDPRTKEVAALDILTNAFCSGGSQLADGTVVNVGGNAGLDFIDSAVGNGLDAVRYLRRSPSVSDGLDGRGWEEPGAKLSSGRWYASAQNMPDGSIFVCSGSLDGLDPGVPANNNPTYEVLDASGRPAAGRSAPVPMDILVRAQPYYMYPFLHLLRDGSLFVLVAKAAEIFSATANATVRALPDLPGDYRTYPNTGGSVLLPLSPADSHRPDVVVCGGGPYQDATAPADASCGRIRPLDDDPRWELDAMPEGRVMVEATLLLDGTVLWLNGAGRGAQGFGLATDPTTVALVYDPARPLGDRWRTDADAGIARLYHSVSLMLPDGTVLVAGSNPVEMPVLEPSDAEPYVTEFRVQRYTPPYLAGANKARMRPANVMLGGGGGGGEEEAIRIAPGGATFTVRFALPNPDAADVRIVLYDNGFVTHSLHMGHRMVYCEHEGFVGGSAEQVLDVTPPPSTTVTPPGFYMLFVVADGVPSEARFVQVG